MARFTRRGFLATVAVSPLASIWAQEPKYVPGTLARPNDRSDEVGSPYNLFREFRTQEFHFSGVMPDGQGVAQNLKHNWPPGTKEHVYQAMYQLQAHPWAGVSALLDGKWNTDRNFSVFEKINAQRGDTVVLRFRARSPDGAVVKFKLGGGQGDSIPFPIESDWIKLPTEWQLITIDTDGQDLGRLKTAFTWIMERERQAEGKKVVELMIHSDGVWFAKLREPVKK